MTVSIFTHLTPLREILKSNAVTVVLLAQGEVCLKLQDRKNIWLWHELIIICNQPNINGEFRCNAQKCEVNNLKCCQILKWSGRFILSALEDILVGDCIHETCYSCHPSPICMGLVLPWGDLGLYLFLNISFLSSDSWTSKTFNRSS